MSKIQLSFKKSERDLQLYMKLMEIDKGERSSFIKHCIRYYLKNKKVEK